MTVVPLAAENPGPMTGTGNWTYLLPGPASVLIDAGVGHAAHLAALFAQVGEGPADVLVTHIHPDHALGAPAIHARAPAARFRKSPWPARDRAVPVPWLPLADGDRIPAGGGVLRAVHTPGHSPDHLAFLDEDSGTAFTGDLLVLGSTVVIPASHGGVLADYLRSLERLVALGIRRALPAHGPAIEDPLALIDHYVTHRRQRELQVLDALAAGAGDVAAIAAWIYRGLDAALVPQAQDSVRAHLVKLAGDGLAEQAGTAWRLRR